MSQKIATTKRPQFTWDSNWRKNLMSSSLLNKRIILHIEAKKCSNDVQHEQKDEEEVKDSSPPAKKTYLGACDSQEIDSDVNGTSTTDISTIQICQVSSSGPVDPGSNGGLKQRTKLWMKPGGSNRSPRVGSDFQATIE